MMDNARVNFYPFCADLFKDPLHLAGRHCVGCQFSIRAGLAISVNGSVENYVPGVASNTFCNPDLEEFPLPLYRCDLCNRSLLDAALAYILVVSCGTIALNVWSIFVWLSTKRKRPQIYFKLSLAISDLLFGAVVLPETASHLVNTMYVGDDRYYAFDKITNRTLARRAYWEDWEAIFAPYHIRFSAAILYISQGASLCSILLLTIDRHIAISYDIRYQRIMTKKRSLSLILAMWAVIITLAMLTTFLTGTFIVKPPALFLPVVEVDEHGSSMDIILIYLAPLTVVFLANVVVTAYTSYELRKGAVASSGFMRNQKWAASTATIDSLRSTQLQSAPNSARPSIPTAHEAENIKWAISPPDSNENDCTCDEDSDQDTLVKSVGSRLEPTGLGARKASKVSFLETVSEIYEGSDTKGTAALNTSESSDSDDSNSETESRGKVANQTEPEILEENIPTSNKKLPSAVNRTIRYERRNEHKAANRTLILILFIYTLCVLPLVVLLAVYLFDETLQYLNDGKESVYESASIGFVVTVGIFMTSSLWNCVIYSVRNREYRRAGRGLMEKLLKKVKMCN